MLQQDASKISQFYRKTRKLFNDND